MPPSKYDVISVRPRSRANLTIEGFNSEPDQNESNESCPKAHPCNICKRHYASDTAELSEMREMGAAIRLKHMLPLSSLRKHHLASGEPADNAHAI